MTVPGGMISCAAMAQNAVAVTANSDTQKESWKSDANMGRIAHEKDAGMLIKASYRMCAS